MRERSWVKSKVWVESEPQAPGSAQDSSEPEYGVEPPTDPQAGRQASEGAARRRAFEQMRAAVFNRKVRVSEVLRELARRQAEEEHLQRFEKEMLDRDVNRAQRELTIIRAELERLQHAVKVNK